MSAEQVGAVAAIVAVVISSVNVLISARLVRHQENVRWTRDVLPTLVAQFVKATHRWEVKIFENDWTAIPEAERESFGMPEAAEALELLDQLGVFAGSKVISAAHKAFDAVDAIRMERLALGDQVERTYRSWDLYWNYAEAKHAFLCESRREMGLEQPPIPGGLAARRAAAVRQPEHASTQPLQGRHPQTSDSSI